MYNLVLLAAKPPEWTHEQFIDWWRGDHAELTYRLPGLRAWRHTEIDQALEQRSEGWDGMSVAQLRLPGGREEGPRQPEWADAVAQVGDMKGRRIAVMGFEAEMFTG